MTEVCNVSHNTHQTHNTTHTPHTHTHTHTHITTHTHTHNPHNTQWERGFSVWYVPGIRYTLVHYFFKGPLLFKSIIESKPTQFIISYKTNPAWQVANLIQIKCLYPVMLICGPSHFRGFDLLQSLHDPPPPPHTTHNTLKSPRNGLDKTFI